jgi:hypothetical protein
MLRPVTFLLLAVVLLTACGGADDPVATVGASDAAAVVESAAEAIDDADAEAAAALSGFCEDMGAWVAALQEYQAVEAGSPEEAAAVAEMERLTPLIADRVDIPPLVDALESVTADASAFVAGEQPASDEAALQEAADLINGILTNCQ